MPDDNRHNGLLTYRPPAAPPGYSYKPTADGYEIQQSQPGLDGTIAAWAQDQPIDAAALATTPIPIVGDVAGFANDMRHYWSNPEERTWTNYGLTAVGLMPFMPSAMPLSRGMGRIGSAKQAGDHVHDAATYEPEQNERDMLAQLLRGNS